MKLVIKESSWSGWSKDYKPEEVEKEYDLVIDKKYTIKKRRFIFQKDKELIEEEREIFSFEINEINDNSIIIHTFQAFSDNEGNSINLMSNKTDFEITSEKPLQLVTPTTDAGEIYILSLVK